MQRGELTKNILIIAITGTIIALIVIFMFLSEDNSKIEEEDNLEAIITKPNSIFIGESDEAEFTLSGENSTGKIVEYLWDYTDSYNSESFQDKETSTEIHKTYSESGKYWFALKVINKNGLEAQNSTFISINYHEEYTYKIKNDESNNQTFPVNWGAFQIKVSLTYPSGGTPPNNLSLTLYDNEGERVDRGKEEERTEGGNQIVEITLMEQEIYSYKLGNWNAEVRRDDENVFQEDIEYDLVIEVIYEDGVFYK